MNENHQRKRYTDANRAAWNEAAPVHARQNQARLLDEVRRPGFNTLAPHVLERLRDIRVEGKSVAQVGCNNGRELLSLKTLGAGRCVGFDHSEAFLAQARELAAASGAADVEFVLSDVYDIPSRSPGRFDLVVTTIGVLGWMPDLDAYFDVVASLIAPGGHLFMEEIHPVLNMWEEDPAGGPSQLTWSYFKHTPWQENGGIDYWSGEKYASKPMYSFQHTLSSLMMACLDRGLLLRHFAELDFDISTLCADLEQAEVRPPMGMTLVWENTTA